MAETESLDELIEQSAKKAEELLQALAPAKSRIADIRELVDRSNAKLDSIDEVSADFRALLSGLQDLSQKVEGAKEHVSGLDAIEETATAAAESFATRFSETKAQADETMRVAASMKEASTERQQGLTELLTEIDANSEGLGTKCEQEGGRSGELASTLLTAIGEANEAMEELDASISEGLEALREAFANAAEELAQSCAAFVEAGSEAIGEASTAAESAVTQSAESLEASLVTELMERLTANSEEVSDGIGSAMEVVSGIEETLDGSIGEVMDQLEQVVELIETIKPVLELVEELLG